MFDPSVLLFNQKMSQHLLEKLFPPLLISYYRTSSIKNPSFYDIWYRYLVRRNKTSDCRLFGRLQDIRSDTDTSI